MYLLTIYEHNHDPRTTLGPLKKEAREAAQWRGHILSRFVADGRRASAECINCGMTVHVDIQPPPNGIELSGNALALNCQFAGTRRDDV